MNVKDEEILSLSIPYPADKQKRLKRLVGVTGAKSVRAFVVEAIDNEIQSRLAAMSPENLSATIRLLDGE